MTFEQRLLYLDCLPDVAVISDTDAQLYISDFSCIKWTLNEWNLDTKCSHMTTLMMILYIMNIMHIWLSDTAVLPRYIMIVIHGCWYCRVTQTRRNAAWRVTRLINLWYYLYCQNDDDNNIIKIMIDRFDEFSECLNECQCHVLVQIQLGLKRILIMSEPPPMKIFTRVWSKNKADAWLIASIVVLLETKRQTFWARRLQLNWRLLRRTLCFACLPDWVYKFVKSQDQVATLSLHLGRTPLARRWSSFFSPGRISCSIVEVITICFGIL